MAIFPHNPLCLLNGFLKGLTITSLSSEPDCGLALMSGNMNQMSKAEVLSSWVACVTLNNLNNIERLKWRKNYTHQFSELSDKEVRASLQCVLNCVAIA